MNTGLSKRERFLVFIAIGVAVFFIGGGLIVAPLNNKLSEHRELHEQLLLEKQVMDEKLNGESQARAEFADAEKSYEELRRKYPAMLSNVAVERTLVELDEKNGLELKTLNMSGDLGYIRSREMLNTKQNGNENGDESAGEGGGENDDAGNAAPPYGIITASQGLRGGLRGLIGLLGMVEEIEYIRTSGLSFTNSEGKDSNISISFEIIVLEESISHGQ